MKNSPKIPGWAAGVVLGLVIVGVALFLLKNVGGEGERDPSTYPKEAYQPPAYTPPAGTYTKDGKPVGGPGGTPANGPGYPTRPPQ